MHKHIKWVMRRLDSKVKRLLIFHHVVNLASGLTHLFACCLSFIDLFVVLVFASLSFQKALLDQSLPDRGRTMVAKIVGVLLFTLLADLPLAASTPCFTPQGYKLLHYGVCDPRSPISLCCITGDTCLSNGLCAGPFDELYRGGCSDKSYLSTRCPNFCVEGDSVHRGLCERTGLLIGYFRSLDSQCERLRGYTRSLRHEVLLRQRKRTRDVLQKHE